MKVKFGSQELEYPDPNFGTLRESNDVLYMGRWLTADIIH
jgi:hypothetical protein